MLLVFRMPDGYRADSYRSVKNRTKGAEKTRLHFFNELRSILSPHLTLN